MPTRILPLAVLAALACSGEPTGTSDTPPEPVGDPVPAATIQVLNDFYSPSTVLISAGGTVTWTWVGSGHSVTSAGSPSFSPTAGVSNPPKTLGPVTFANGGTYQFYCTVHGIPGTYGGGQMTGAVFVE
jgi:plastocyanin